MREKLRRTCEDVNRVAGLTGSGRTLSQLALMSNDVGWLLQGISSITTVSIGRVISVEAQVNFAQIIVRFNVDEKKIVRDQMKNPEIYTYQTPSVYIPFSQIRVRAFRNHNRCEAIGS